MDLDKLIKIRNRVLNNTENSNAEVMWALNELDTLIHEEKEKLTVKPSSLQLKEKKIKDLLNWVKSDLAQETNIKLGKTATPYRSEKIKFLNKLIELDSL